MIAVTDVYPGNFPKKGNSYRIICYLCALGPGYLATYQELYDLLWSGREDGGPDLAYLNFQQAVLRLRHRLMPGWKIITEKGRGILLEREESLHRDLPNA